LKYHCIFSLLARSRRFQRETTCKLRFSSDRSAASELPCLCHSAETTDIIDRHRVMFRIEPYRLTYAALRQIGENPEGIGDQAWTGFNFLCELRLFVSNQFCFYLSTTCCQECSRAECRDFPARFKEASQAVTRSEGFPNLDRMY
jgi:hypothetical protein